NYPWSPGQPSPNVASNLTDVRRVLNVETESWEGPDTHAARAFSSVNDFGGLAGETAKAASSHRCRAAGPCNGCFDLDAGAGSDRIAFAKPGVERIAFAEPLIVSQANDIAERFSVSQA